MSERRQRKASPRAMARDRIIAPVDGLLRRAGMLSVAAGLVWPVQAAAIAWAVAGWVGGDADAARTLTAAGIIAAGGILRAALDHRAGALLFRAADATIARERRALIGREARAVTGAGSAAIASLAVQKLPLLQPWITRYHVAMTRVSVLPPCFWCWPSACHGSWA